MSKDLKKYEKDYSENGLFEKIKKFAKKAGKGLILNVLKLYYAMEMGKATPAQIAAIIGALDQYSDNLYYAVFVIFAVSLALILHFLNKRLPEDNFRRKTDTL